MNTEAPPRASIMKPAAGATKAWPSSLTTLRPRYRPMNRGFTCSGTKRVWTADPHTSPNDSTIIAMIMAAGERKYAKPRNPAANASFDAPAERPIRDTRSRLLAGNCANTQISAFVVRTEP